jgi:hypothetical protein
MAVCRFLSRGKGLERAEEIADSNGYDLYEEIEEFEKNSETGTTHVPASDRVVSIDHNSQEYLKVRREIDDVTAAARASNSLSANAGVELDQRLAEIEAGKILLNAPQANPGLVEKLIIPALKRIAEKIADNLIAILVNSVIAGLLALLGLTLL